jgi:2-haloacid dehalogenase
MSARVVVFDLGGVLLDWNPRYLYRKLLADDAAVEEFLGAVCTQAWNEQQDAGRPLAEATAALIAEHPHRADLIRCFYERWEEMLAGPVAGTVDLLEELDRRGVPLYALTNFSAETFRIARRRFDFLTRFRGVVVSGEERLIKPDPRFFRILFERHAIAPAEAVFIDDSATNVDAARALGMIALHFRGAPDLRRQLAGLGLVDDEPSRGG